MQVSEPDTDTQRSDWLWAIVAASVVSLVVAGRDLSSVGLSPAATLATTAGLLLVVYALLQAGLERLWGRIESESLSRWISALIGGGVPLLLGGADWWTSRSALPAWSPVVFISAAALAGVVLYHQTPRSERMSLLTIAICGWYLLHDNCDVFVIIRPGTELLHLGLFLGTWGASVGFALVIPDGRRRTPLWMSALVLILGVGLLEIDRRALVDLYLPIHIWLFAWGLLASARSVEQGLLLAFEKSESSERPTLRRVVPVVGVLALILGMVVGVTTLRDAPMRAELARSPVGNTLLSQVSLGDSEESTVADAPAPKPTVKQLQADVPGLTEPVSYARKLNLLLITVDALRPDVLTTGSWISSRHMRELGRRSLRYERAYAQGSRTAIGMGSLMTGKYSAHIDWKLLVYRKGQLFDPAFKTPELKAILAGPHAYTTVPHWPKEGTLAERLKRAGYYTAAAPYAGNNRFFASGVGFDRGFDDFADLTGRSWRTPTSDNVVKVATAQLEVAISQEKPWFQWIHLYDPHRWRKNRQDYNRLVGHVDTEVGRLVRWLTREGQIENTAIALIADHGEAFGEHRHKRHGTSLYDEQALVPFILYVPGVTPQVHRMPVAAIDLTATFLAIAGADMSKIDGRNLLVDAMAGREPGLRTIYTELHRYISRKRKRTTDLKAVIRYPHKLILDRRRRTPRLFNLDSDPKETQNLVSADKLTYARMRRHLRRFLRRAEKKHPLP